MWPVRWPPPRTFSPCPLDINNIGELFAAGSDFSSEMTAVGRCMLLIKPGQFFSYSSSMDKLVKSGRFDAIGGESHKGVCGGVLVKERGLEKNAWCLWCCRLKTLS